MEDNLSDRIAVRLLVRTFPPDLVDHVVAECGRSELRSRRLPARTVVYFVLAICLFWHRSYGQVVQLLAESLNWADRGRNPVPPLPPTTAALSRARARLGPEPMAALFSEAVMRSSAARATCDSYRRWRVLAADAATVSVPDTPDNRARYGATTPVVERVTVRTSLPRARVAVLAECGSDTITKAAVGLPVTSTDPTLARELFTGLSPEDLVLADCGAEDLNLLPAVRASGADLLWRVRAEPPMPWRTAFPDSSYLSGMCDSSGRCHTEVRVIEEGSYFLVTTLLDHEAHPARHLRALAHRYRDFGISFQAVGKLWRDGPLVLRSRWPAGVEQEVWGHLLVHHTLRSLM
ncbi:transposase domain-containing protein [Streptomyces sp. RP5T]|uniref:transposase domain-containing protein n=1 Tax=Streptomyces sp. RP5T TaxID=2490848 RepID=UPI00163B2589|nr:transposase domain-containing protein [Streptomyces sp. RP5T]